MTAASSEGPTHKQLRPNASSVNELAPTTPPPASAPKAVVPPSPFLAPVPLPPKPAALPPKPPAARVLASDQPLDPPKTGKKARARAARQAALDGLATSFVKAPPQNEVEVELRARLASMAAARASAALAAVTPPTPANVEKVEPTLAPVPPPQPEAVAGPPETEERATTSNKVSDVISALVTTKLEMDVLGPLLGLLTSVLVDTLEFEKARDLANFKEKSVPETPVAPVVVAQSPPAVVAAPPPPPILSATQLAAIDGMDDNFASVLKLLRNLGRHIVARRNAEEAVPSPTTPLAVVTPATASLTQEPKTPARVPTPVPAPKAVVAAATEPELEPAPAQAPTPIRRPVPATQAVEAADTEPEPEPTPGPSLRKRLSISASSEPIVPTFALNAIAPTPKKPTAQELLDIEADDCIIVDSSPVKPRIPIDHSLQIYAPRARTTSSSMVVDEPPRILKRPRSQSPVPPRAQSPVRGLNPLPRRLPSPPPQPPAPIAHRIEPICLPTGPRQTFQQPPQQYQQRSYSSSYSQSLPSRPSYPPSSRDTLPHLSNNNSNNSSSSYNRAYDNRYDPYEREAPRRLDDRLGPPAADNRRYASGGGYYDPRDSRSRSPDRGRGGRSRSRSR